MTPAARAFVRTLVVLVGAVAAALATSYSCVEAVRWSLRTVGDLPVLLIATAIVSVIVDRAVLAANAALHRPRSHG